MQECVYLLLESRGLFNILIYTVPDWVLTVALREILYFCLGINIVICIINSGSKQTCP